MDQEFYRRHSVTEMKEDSSKALSAAARRSFFRRKQKHKRSSSKDSKETVALDTISTDSIPFFDGEEASVFVLRPYEAWIGWLLWTFDWSASFLGQTVSAWLTSESRKWSAPLPDQCSFLGLSVTLWKRCWWKNLLGSSADVYLVNTPPCFIFSNIPMAILHQK